MHIPDGFLDVPTVVATGAAAAGTGAFALRRTATELGERTIPLLGVTAAFIFAAQMLNFPVAGGTSGHFLGALLAAVLLGPWPTVVIFIVVLAVQTLGMADGGITALGANILNMGVVGGLGGYLVFRILTKILPRNLTGYLSAVAVAAWLSVVLASIAAALELAVSGTVPLRVVLPAMSGVHMVIGLGEALITTTVLGGVLASRPDLVRHRPAISETRALRRANYPRPSASPRRLWGFVAGALVVALALAVLISPFASSAPDGLERVAQDKGFEHAAEDPVWKLSPIPDYTVPGIANEKVAVGTAGLIGTAALFGAVLLLGRALGRRPRLQSGFPAGHAPEAHSLGGHEHADHRHAGHEHTRHEHLQQP